jgi:PrtD family type I secretion system ABC transporter
MAQAAAACRAGLGAVIAFSAVINLLILALPVYSLQVFDRVLSSRSLETLAALTLLTIALLALQAALDHIRSLVMRRLALRLETGLTPAVLRITIAEAARGNIHAAGGMNDLREVRSAMLNPGLTALFDAPWAPLFLIVVFLIHPLLGWFVAAAIVALAALAGANAIAARQPQALETGTALATREGVNDYVRHAEAIQAMGMTGNVLERWLAQNGRGLARSARIAGRIGLVLAVTKFMRMAVQVGITGLGAWLVLRNAITPGGMIASALLMSRVLAPLEQAVGGWNGWVSAWSALRRLTAALGAAHLPRNALKLPAPKGALQVQGVVYRPVGHGDPVLRGISFNLEAGNSLAIVGPSGAGKSTLARLIAGAWLPSAGEIRLDGVDLASWDRNDLGRHVGYLPQDVQLLNGTVAENISRFDPDPAAEAVIAAAESAGIHDLVLRLPNGYDTVLGEGGVQLSGGQQQRLGLARAIYGDPRLVILDEPNSHLDPEGESALVDAIVASRRAGRTIIMVSHRPTLLRTADWMIVLREGRIERAGARGDLMQTLGGAGPAKLDARRPPQPAIA